jgi:hypothetical protein
MSDSCRATAAVHKAANIRPGRLRERIKAGVRKPTTGYGAVLHNQTGGGEYKAKADITTATQRLLSLNYTMSTMTPLASNTLLLRRQLAELTKHPVEGFSAGAYPTILLQSFQRPRPDSHLREGLVDENNLYEWEVMIIGFASPPSPSPPFPVCPPSPAPPLTRSPEADN